MNGKYYGVYDMRNDETCVGTFESTREIAAFFGGIRLNRIHCAITRGNPLTFGSKRFWVEVFTEPTRKGTERPIRKALSKKYGKHFYKLTEDGQAFYRLRKSVTWIPIELPIIE